MWHHYTVVTEMENSQKSDSQKQPFFICVLGMEALQIYNGRDPEDGDNIFSNSLCKPHTSGILTHYISDHFMKYIEVEHVNQKSIANFKNFVAKSELISQLDNNPYADPNHNYNIL